MRDIFLLLAVTAGIGVSLLYPFAGVLLWAWISVASPHMETFGFARTLPLNMIVAIATAVALLLSRDRKLPPSDSLLWLCGLFLVWCTINGFAAVDPGWSWPYWSRTWKVFALGLFVVMLARNKVRLHALTWIIVVSLFYYGVKGGIFTIISGGGSHVYGPGNTIIGDNNQLALALLMTLPLANYLRTQSARRWVSLMLLAGMAMTVIAILGTYSRGGFIGLAALSVAGWLRIRNKWSYLAVTGVVLITSLYFMPVRFYARLGSINSYGTDESFQGRVTAWHVAYNYARDHFPFGAGFYGPQLAQVFHTYFPNGYVRAAHSIYFQVLGEQGFVGLAIYLSILAVAFLLTVRIMKATRGDPESAWAHQLTGMIQLGLIVFCISGAALSMAYYEVFIIYLGVLVSLREQFVTAVVRGPARRFRAESARPAPDHGMLE